MVMSDPKTNGILQTWAEKLSHDLTFYRSRMTGSILKPKLWMQTVMFFEK